MGVRWWYTMYKCHKRNENHRSRLKLPRIFKHIGSGVSPVPR